MKPDPRTIGSTAALRYLTTKGALHKLAQPVPVIGRQVVFLPLHWQTPVPCPATLPPLERGARL